MDIRISEIRIRLVKPVSGLVGFCSFIVNESFFIGDVAIYSRMNGGGYRLRYPDRLLANGARFNCVHPIRKDVADAVERAVGEELLRALRGVAKSERRRSYQPEPITAYGR